MNSLPFRQPRHAFTFSSTFMTKRGRTPTLNALHSCTVNLSRNFHLFQLQFKTNPLKSSSVHCSLASSSYPPRLNTNLTQFSVSSFRRSYAYLAKRNPRRRGIRRRKQILVIYLSFKSFCFLTLFYVLG